MLVGVISTALSYGTLITPATTAAISIRRKLPEAWFSGLITWYAEFVVIGASIVIGGAAFRVVYKHIARPTP
jgi:hypothetical protein